MQELYPGCSTDDPFEFLMRIGLNAGHLRDLTPARAVMAEIIGGPVSGFDVQARVLYGHPLTLYGHAAHLWREVGLLDTEEQIRAKVVQHILNHGAPDLRPGRNR